MCIDVLEKDVLRLALADNPRDFGPEMTRVFASAFLPGCAERLAWISRNEAMNLSAPRAAVEGSEVAPNRSFIEGAVCKTRSQERRCSSFPFHVTDGSSCWDSELKPKVESTDAGAEAEDLKPFGM